MRLPRSFFARDTRLVARELLGNVLCRQMNDGTRLSGAIVETEAYRPGDAASHAYRRVTERNASMFGPPGTAYVYFTYGMHYCLNVVTETVGVPAAVLLRAVEPIDGIATMFLNRLNNEPDVRTSRAIHVRDLCRGPARLCKALNITREFDGADLCEDNSPIHLELGQPVPEDGVRTARRVGVSGDPTAVAIEWRWLIANSRFVSRS